MRTSIRTLLASSLVAQALAADHRFERNYEEDKVVEGLSFGQRGTTWSDDHRKIDGWDFSGDGYTPELYSDRIIVTPPWPGSRKGSLWAQKPEIEPEWEATFEFRVNGPEKGNGNMQFWYVKEPKENVGNNGIYTVGKFDGVAIVVSQAGEKPGIGTVRAFLNDGSINFNAHSKVDELAFGQCDYSYRNLGVFSKITVEQTFWTFKVFVDGQKCISTYSIHLPHNYHFGITAQSSEPPDSFEVKSFVVHTIKEGKKVIHDHGASYKADWHDYDNEAEQWSHDAADHLKMANKESRRKPAAPASGNNAQKPILQRRNEDLSQANEPLKMSSEDEAAFSGAKSDSKRIDLIHKQIGLLWSDITRMRKQIDQQQNEVTQLLSRVESHMHTISGDTDNTKHTVEMLEKEMSVVKNSVKDSLTLNDMRKEMEGLKDMLTHNKDFKELLEVMNWKMSDHHEDFHEAFTKNSPRMKTFAFFMIASNVLIVGGYILYAKRKESSSKKWM